MSGRGRAFFAAAALAAALAAPSAPWSSASASTPRLAAPAGRQEGRALVKSALENQGFSVTVVMDPDRDGIDRAFRDFIDRYGDKANNRLLFYFAGHGHTMKLAYGGQMGYLVGRDAPNPNIDKVGSSAPR